MARIFVAHTEQGAPNILGGAADAIQQQRMLEQEQQQAAREQALAEREFEYQRQRDKISDKFKREELALKRQSARTSGAADISELQAIKFGAAQQVEAYFDKFNRIPEDRRMPAEQRQAGQQRIENLLAGIELAPDVKTANVYTALLKAEFAEGDEAREKFERGLELDDLTRSRDTLVDQLLDPNFVESGGISEDRVRNLVAATDEPDDLRNQIIQLENIKIAGETNARLQGVLTDITEGTFKDPFAKEMAEKHESARAPGLSPMQALLAQKTVEPTWISKYEGWTGRSGKLAKMNDLTVPVGERNEYLKEYLGLLRLEANPELKTVREAMVRTTAKLRELEVRAQAESELLSAVTQATLPELDRVASGLRQIASGTEDEYTPEERELASAMEDVLLSDEDLASGRVGQSALVQAFRQVQSVMDIDPEVAAGLMMRIQQMGLPGARQPAAQASDNAQPARRSVLDMPAQGDPLAGQRRPAGRGAVDFSVVVEDQGQQ